MWMWIGVGDGDGNEGEDVVMVVVGRWGYWEVWLRGERGVEMEY